MSEESTQQLVRATMARMGGYWRPLAAVARLLEELGELAESLPSSDLSGAEQGSGELASELADLWIITSALADQFLGEVAEPGASLEPGAGQTSTHGRHGRDVRGPGAGRDQLGELFVAAGQIARIVNYYDGPKTPRSLAGWPSLSGAVAELHRALTNVADAHAVDLSRAVRDKLREIEARDSGRFAQAEHDPSTAPSLDQFRGIKTTASGERVEQARLWGAPEWSAQSLATNVGAIAPTLTTFTRAALRERLDGYVITGPALESVELLGDWARAVLSVLAEHDPVLSVLAEHDPRRLQQARDAVEGAFTFNGVLLSVRVYCQQNPHLLLQAIPGLRSDSSPR